MWAQPLGQEVTLEKEMATHSSFIAWRIPWTEGPGGLQTMGSQRVRHTWICTHSTSVPSSKRELIKTDKTATLPKKKFAEKENKKARSEKNVGGTGGLKVTKGGTLMTHLKYTLIRVFREPTPTLFKFCISQDPGFRILEGKAPHPYILIFKHAHLFLSKFEQHWSTHYSRKLYLGTGRLPRRIKSGALGINSIPPPHLPTFTSLPIPLFGGSY